MPRPPALSLPDAHGFATLGAIDRVETAGSGVTLVCGEARLRLQFLSDAVVRLRLAPAQGEFGRDFSYALDPDTSWPGPTTLAVEETEAALTIRTGALTVRTEKATCRLRVLDAQGEALVEDEAGPSWDAVGENGTNTVVRTALSLRLHPGERLFGLGDKPVALDRRGHRFENWNTDAFRYTRGTDPLYKSIPFLVGLREGRAYGLFVDAPGRTVFDLGAADDECLRVEAPGTSLDYYLMTGATPLAVVQAFARLTGRQAMQPKWALGYHQCRYSYRDEAEIREVARELRTRGIPCDALYFDIHYMDGYRVFTWDREAFPDPAALLTDLHRDGFRSVVIVDPGVKADDPGYAVARDGLAREAFVRLPDGTPFVGQVWPGPCYFPDFTRPDVRAWWGDLHTGFVEQGVDGVWNDMNEPAVFEHAHLDDSMDAEKEVVTLPDDARHDFDGYGADHAEAHNVYGSQMLRATYEGLGRLAPERRPFTITRAAYAGGQRFGTAWTGDNAATWDHLKLAVEQCLSLGVSGFPFVGADVGGFSGTPDGELMARWTQVGALTPLFRNHSAVDTPHQEPWRYGEEVERVCREAIELRMRLLPYLYTTLRDAAEDGTPMLRPLAFLHPDDERVRQTGPLGFYVGDALLAHPVLEPGQRRREVYLPAAEGGWFDVHTGRHLEGGSAFRVDTPLDHLPLFVRAGTVLPTQPVLQHVDERPVETLTLHVFPRRGTFASRLYDDAGDGWAFRDGAFWHGTILGESDPARLVLRTEVDGTYTPPWTTWDWVVYGSETAPAAVRANGEPVAFTAAGGTVRFRTAAGVGVEIER